MKYDALAPVFKLTIPLDNNIVMIEKTKSITRRLFWRIGRNLYRRARLDVGDGIESNGEARLQWDLVKNFALVSDICADEEIVVFDIGSNKGNWSLALIKCFEFYSAEERAKIFCFEPFPGTYQVSEKALDKWIDGGVVKAERLALSNEVGERFMFGAAGRGTSSLSQRDEFGPTERVEIECDTIDNYCSRADIAFIHFAKCDAEGHDFFVLEGARGMLESASIGVFQFEYNHLWIDSRKYLKDVFDMIEELPYQVCKITPSQIEHYDVWHFELERYFDANYALVRDDLVGKLKLRRLSRDISNTFA